MSLTKEQTEFYQKHQEDLQKQIWLMELDLAIIRQDIRGIHNKKESEMVLNVYRDIDKKKRAVQLRLIFVGKVLHGTIELGDEKTEGQGFTSV